MLHSLISRNNDVKGYWAPGLLYADASMSPHVMEIDLLAGTSTPDSASARQMAANYAVYLRRAIEKLGFEWHHLTAASIKFEFNAEVEERQLCVTYGDAFIATVTLHTSEGLSATLSKTGWCHPFRPGVYTRSADWEHRFEYG